MATTALARVMGTVLKVDVRSGIARESGQPFRIESIRVLVENLDITEFTVPDGEAHRFIDGEEVDCLVSFSVSQRGDLRGRLVKVLALT